MTFSYYRSDLDGTTVLILGGKSEIGAHCAYIKLGNMICSRHLFRSKDDLSTFTLAQRVLSHHLLLLPWLPWY